VVPADFPFYLSATFPHEDLFLHVEGLFQLLLFFRCFYIGTRKILLCAMLTCLTFFTPLMWRVVAFPLRRLQLLDRSTPFLVVHVSTTSSTLSTQFPFLVTRGIDRSAGGLLGFLLCSLLPVYPSPRWVAHLPTPLFFSLYIPSRPGGFDLLFSSWWTNQAGGNVLVVLLSCI